MSNQYQCVTCGKGTDAWKAKRAEQSRLNPIYGTNLQRPLSEIVKELRERMVQLRGGFSDFRFAYPGWHERTEPVEGLLTCGISTLYAVLKELEEFERKTEKTLAAGEKAS